MPPIRVLIADQIAGIVDDLAKLSAFDSEVDVCGVARSADAVIEETQRHQPDVLLLSEAFLNGDPAMFTERLATVAPGTHVVLVTSSPTAGPARPPTAAVVSAFADAGALVHAIRGAAGVATVTDEAATDTDLEDQSAAPEAEPIQELVPRRRAPRTAATRGDVFVVFSGKGGVGKSVIATNVAVALSIDTGARVALVDLDLQYGDVAVMLHVENHLTSIEDLAQQGEQVDGEFLDEVLAVGPEDVRVLLAPSSPEFADLVTTANLRSIFRELGKAYDFIVVDSPAHLEERILEVIETADHILLVTAFNVTAVRSTRITLKLLHSLGIEPDRIAIILNQTRPKVTFERAEVEEILRFRVLAQMPYEPRIDDSVDNGRPLVIAEPKADMTRQFHTLVDYLAPAQRAEAPDDGRSQPRAQPRAVSRRRFSLGRR